MHNQHTPSVALMFKQKKNICFSGSTVFCPTLYHGGLGQSQNAINWSVYRDIGNYFPAPDTFP